MKIIEVTISGKDSGGYIFQNVSHYQTDDTETTDATLLEAMNSAIVDNVITPYTNCMNSSSTILNVASRMKSPTPGFTINLPMNEPGTVEGDPAVGALCGKIGFYPDAGYRVGRMFVAGPVDQAFTDDQATSTYQGELQSLGDAFVGIMASIGTYHFQFGLWGKPLSGFVAFTRSKAMGSPGVLSKRIRT